MTRDAHAAAAHAARASYGMLVAYLAAQTRDLAEAEDALADAFAKALQAWPKTGVPASPEAWLLSAARTRFRPRPSCHLLRADAQDLLTQTQNKTQAAAR